MKLKDIFKKHDYSSKTFHLTFVSMDRQNELGAFLFSSRLVAFLEKNIKTALIFPCLQDKQHLSNYCPCLCYWTAKPYHLRNPPCANHYSDATFSKLVQERSFFFCPLRKLRLSNFFNLIYFDTRNFFTL